MSDTLFELQVSPRLPEALRRLEDLAGNFWFSWYPGTGQLFRKLDAPLWRAVGSSPRLFLRSVDQSILESAADSPEFMRDYDAVVSAFDRYLAARPPLPDGLVPGDLIAYFCAEYGWHESFPIYSGGLGVLAGDHCKTASDLGLPFVAVGLLYRQGYFNQRIDRTGQQLSDYTNIDPRNTPLVLATRADGTEVRVTCPGPERTISVRVWKAPVGRVTVLLLDTDVPENSAEDRKITYRLYGGDEDLRVQQEAVLGVAGVRALRALGLEPTVWHINEGHAAFSVIERLREHTTRGLSFDAALEAVAAATVFTTHTPVSAGHDRFPLERVARQFQSLLQELGVPADRLLDLGRSAEQGDRFNMTRLAISGSGAVNGVSKIHGRVSSRLCQSVWPDVPAAENPVGYVTNGVHVATFLRNTWASLFDRHLGPEWRERLMDRPLMSRIMEIPDELYWRTNQSVKSQLLRVLRERLSQQYQRNGLSEAHVHRMLKLVDPDDPNVLTIGFGRRFATYKRATLLLADLRWLEQILGLEDRPVLFVFSGKAHPADEPAQWMMREIQRISNLPPFVGRILLIEGYDMGLSRVLTSGVDVWLNTPVHPYEASGTSGMKAAINGTVNLSVLDGWWAEAYDGRKGFKNGWGIPPSLDEQGAADRDRNDATTLYEILQDEVVPLYYARDEKLGYSPEWVRLCKRSMASVLPAFNSERVLRDYLQGFYAPAAHQGRIAAADDFKVARDLGAWKTRARAAWPGVALKMVSRAPAEIGFGQRAVLEVDVALNGLSPDDVRVECVVRRMVGSEVVVPVNGYTENRRPGHGVFHRDGRANLVETFVPGAVDAAGVCRYRLEMQPPWAGTLQYEIRAVPQHPNLSHPYELGLLRGL
ncbi:MAG TPA: alpha-glucan family phosphorylase [Gammaproteobacteria bacterium]|jgi:starch phosphorylase|nr:alpha-glucan family phosphorylase [Gammaproteobacteria bacterium]